MIKLDNVTYKYPGSALPAIESVSAEICPGIYLLLGENGAGKTTLLKVMDALLLPQSGACFIDSVCAGKRLPATESKVAYYSPSTTMPQRDINSLALTHARFYPRFDANMLRENLAEFRIDPRQKLASMSLGMRQKAIAAYMISLNPEILLLDEPANGLDIESKNKLQSMIARCMADDSTVIISTHTISDLLNLYDGVMVMHASRLLYSGFTDEILSRVAFVSSYSDTPGAIYSEWTGGKIHSIVQADSLPDDAPVSDSIDFRLLYSGLHSPYAGRLIEILTMPAPPAC